MAAVARREWTVTVFSNPQMLALIGQVCERSRPGHCYVQFVTILRATMLRRAGQLRGRAQGWTYRELLKVNTLSSRRVQVQGSTDSNMHARIATRANMLAPCVPAAGRAPVRDRAQRQAKAGVDGGGRAIFKWMRPCIFHS